MRIAHTPIYTLYTVCLYCTMVIVIRVYIGMYSVYMYENFCCGVYTTIEVDQLLLINKGFLYDYGQFLFP